MLNSTGGYDFGKARLLRQGYPGKISLILVLGRCSGKADCLGILQVCLDTGDDHASLNSEDLEAKQGDPDPGIDHKTLIQDPVDNLSQS